VVVVVEGDDELDEKRAVATAAPSVEEGVEAAAVDASLQSLCYGIRHGCYNINGVGFLFDCFMRMEGCR